MYLWPFFALPARRTKIYIWWKFSTLVFWSNLVWVLILAEKWCGMNGYNHFFTNQPDQPKPTNSESYNVIYEWIQHNEYNVIHESMQPDSAKFMKEYNQIQRNSWRNTIRFNVIRDWIQPGST